METVPGPQVLQVLSGTSEKVSAAHLSHLVFLFAAKEPFGHLVHLVSRAFEIVPTGQGEHASSPVSSFELNSPGAQ